MIPRKNLGLAAATLIAASSAANAATVDTTFSSKDVLQGNFEAGGASVFIANNSNARRNGTGGAGGAQRVNQPLLGFTLPTITPGETVGSATFGFTMDGSGVTGVPIGFDMVISLMGETSDADFDGSEFTEDSGILGAGNSLVAMVAAGDVASSSVESFALTGAALTQFAALYDASGNPTQTEVWFRLSTSATVDITDPANDNDRFNLGTVGGASGGDILTTLSFTTVPEPSSLALLGLGALGLISRRRR